MVRPAARMRRLKFPENFLPGLSDEPEIVAPPDAKLVETVDQIRVRGFCNLFVLSGEQFQVARGCSSGANSASNFWHNMLALSRRRSRALN